MEFAGGTGEGQDLTLGSGKMIRGFEDGLIGTKKGDKKELNLTFPEDYLSLIHIYSEHDAKGSKGAYFLCTAKGMAIFRYDCR